MGINILIDLPILQFDWNWLSWHSNHIKIINNHEPKAPNLWTSIFSNYGHNLIFASSCQPLFIIVATYKFDYLKYANNSHDWPTALVPISYCTEHAYLRLHCLPAVPHSPTSHTCLSITSGVFFPSTPLTLTFIMSLKL